MGIPVRLRKVIPQKQEGSRLGIVTTEVPLFRSLARPFFPRGLGPRFLLDRMPGGIGKPSLPGYSSYIPHPSLSALEELRESVPHLFWPFSLKAWTIPLLWGRGELGWYTETQGLNMS